MPYSLVTGLLILVLIINSRLGEAACGDSCPDNFPPTCKSTCGCFRLAVNKSMIMNIDAEYFAAYKPETYFKPTLTWSNCSHVTASGCAGDKQKSIKYTVNPITKAMELEKMSDGFIGASNGSFQCNPSTNQWESSMYPGSMYFWTCAP